MINKLLKYLEGKRIVILGFGVEGKATYQFLRKHFPSMPLVIADSNPMLGEGLEELKQDRSLSFQLGENYLAGLEKYDLIFKSAGISFKDIDTTHFLDKITSELELFLEYVPVYTIGITGTKGKSTTSSLIHQVLKDQGKDSYLIGNIGNPIFREIEKMKEDSIAVIEMSSHMLEFIKSSPNIAILLNVFEEHLDHYPSLNDYVKAKFNIFRYQKKEDLAIYNADNELMQKFGFSYFQETIAVIQKSEEKEKYENAIYREDEFVKMKKREEIFNLYQVNKDRKLKGDHNLKDIEFVLGVCEKLKLDVKKAIQTIDQFDPLPHRMEYVGNFAGVDYYNDSIATIPEATIYCIKALQRVNTLIVGGKDRGINLEELIDFLRKSEIENIICLPKTGEYIKEGLGKIDKYVVKVANMEEAVEIAKKVTKEGKICLLSPAASSYGYFKNFQERGNLFKELVKRKERKSENKKG